MKTLVKILSMIFLAAFTVASCEDPMQEEVVKVSLNRSMISNLPVGATHTLVATLSPADAVATIVWASDNEDVAVVNEEGLVTGVAEGTAVITAAVGNEIAKCKVTVIGVDVKLNKSAIELPVGANQTLVATIEPSSVHVAVEWSSADENVATVDENGKVTAQAPGKTVITAAAGSATATCEVTVTGTVPGGKPTKIELNPSSVKLKVGDEKVLEVVATPANAVINDLQWSSTNSECATITDGLVKALNKGMAVITAKCNNGELAAICQVEVVEEGSEDPDPTPDPTPDPEPEPEPEPEPDYQVAIKVERNATDLQVGCSLKLSIECFPADLKVNSISWSISTNESYARIDADTGVIEGLSAERVDSDWGDVVVSVVANVAGADNVEKECSSTLPLRVIPRQPESIEVNLPADGSIKVGQEWDFNPRVLPEGYGYGVTCSIMKPGNKFTSESKLSSDIPGNIAAQFAVATHDNLVYESYRRNVNVDVLPYWVETLTLPSAQEVEVGGSFILSPEFTSDVAGVQPTSKDLVWTSSNKDVAVVDEKGKVTALASGIVEITATTNGSWSVPSGQSHKSATCTVTVKEAEAKISVGDYYYSDGTTSPTLQAGKTVLGIVISRDNAKSTDKKLPAGCTHGVVLALGEGKGIWSSSYDAGKVNSWATQNGYENTTGTYADASTYWEYVRNEFGNKLLGYNNTSAMKEYIKNNGYSSGILDALAAYKSKVTLPGTASELYIPSIAEMDAVAKNFEVINAALKAAGGTEFVRDTTDNQNDAYWTSSENEVSSGNAATLNPFTGALHGGVMKSKEKKVRFIFAF